MDNQIKSKQRVADHGEVFTAEREVNAMLDLVKDETLRIDSRFLEPACGDGNFLVEILRRKLDVVQGKYKKSTLDYERNAVWAISSIYGIDLLVDNVIACRKRLFAIWDQRYKAVCKKDANDETREAVRFILSLNIVCGNALSMMCVDEQQQDTQEPIIFPEWSFPTNDMRIKRRDFRFDVLLKENPDENSYEGQLNIFGDEAASMENWMIDPITHETVPKPVRDYPPIMYRRLQEMAKTKYTFSVSISPCGDSSVEYPVTAKEKRLIQEAVENGDSFEDVEELSDLYDRVMEAAKEQLAEDLDIGNENDLDPDDLDFCVDFGEEE